MLMTAPPKSLFAKALGLQGVPDGSLVEVQPPRSHPWHILLSEPQVEFKVAEWLLYRGFRPYVPAIRKHTLMRFHKRRSITVPMFRGYVFIQEEPKRTDLWDEIHHTRGCRGGLHPGGVPAILSDEVVDKIRETEKQIADETFLKRKRHAFKLGQQVRVEADPFYGLARIDRLGDSERISVLMNLLGRQTRISVPAYQVQPV